MRLCCSCYGSLGSDGRRALLLLLLSRICVVRKQGGHRLVQVRLVVSAAAAVEGEQWGGR